MKFLLSILFSILGYAVSAQKETGNIIKGNQLYKKQAYNKAAEEYQKAASKNAKSAEAQFNLGNAYYKTKKQHNGTYQPRH